MDVRRIGAGVLVVGMILGGRALAAPHSAAAASLRQSGNATVVGMWLGPAMGDTGACGRAYGQFTFFRNARYAYTTNSESCGGFTNAGFYRLQRGLLSLHWTACNFPCAAGTVAAGFAFLNRNAFALLDQGRTYVYYRQ